MSDRCAACDAPLRFIRTATRGRLMPVDAEPVTYHHWTKVVPSGEAPVVLIDADGVLHRGSVVSTFYPDLVLTGYRPHWATCTNPQRFRTPRGA